MKNILSTLLLLSSVLAVFADDGGTQDFRVWTYGNIYVKEPNDKIALRKELMEVNTDSLKATFVFENTTDEDVVVDCAFPVRVDLKVKVVDKAKEIIGFTGDYSYNNNCPVEFFDIALGANYKLEWTENGVEYPMTYSELKQKADKKLKKWTMDEYKQYLSDLNVLNNSFYSKGCDIVQDGVKVPIENVAMETVVDEDLVLTLHFHHKLKFPKKKESLVVISHDMQFGWKAFGNHGGIDMFNYDISTGGTWKGEMESFVVVTPFKMISDSAEFEVIDSKVNVYSIKGYKPKPNESLYFEYDDSDVNYHIKFPHLKKYKSERYDLKASADMLNPDHLNDGDIYTYISTEDWENSWLEITFDSHVIGPLIVNGLCAERKNQETFFKVFDNDWGEDLSIHAAEFKDTLWKKENRIKAVTLTNVETSEVKTFDLSDEYTALASLRGWETSNCVKKLEVLEPGTYRMNIKGIYKGGNATKTGVSELWFFPIPMLHQILSEDTGSEHPIFGEVPKIVDANLWNKPFREELEGFENFRPSDEIATEESCDSEPDSAILNEQEEPIAKEQVETDSSDSTPAFALFAVVGALALIVIAFVVMRKKKR